MNKIRRGRIPKTVTRWRRNELPAAKIQAARTRNNQRGCQPVWGTNPELGEILRDCVLELVAGLPQRTQRPITPNHIHLIHDTLDKLNKRRDSKWWIKTFGNIPIDGSTKPLGQFVGSLPAATVKRITDTALIAIHSENVT